MLECKAGGGRGKGLCDILRDSWCYEGNWVETGVGKFFLFRCVNIQDQNITELF